MTKIVQKKIGLFCKKVVFKEVDKFYENIYNKFPSINNSFFVKNLLFVEDSDLPDYPSITCH